MGETRLDGPTKVTNGGFETGTTSFWTLSTSRGAAATFAVSTLSPFRGNFDLEITITDVGSSGRADIQLEQTSISCVQGETYSVIFAGTSSPAKTSNLKVAILGISEQILLTGSYQTFEFISICNSTDIGTLIFEVGQFVSDVKLDDISIRLAVDVDPLYNYAFEKNIQRQDARTREGGLITFIQPGVFTKFTLPLTWVNSRDRSFVNSWWETGADLRFIENTDSPGSFSDVRITGGEEPFTTFVRPYFQQFYAGQIILESI